jgi:hypothetical protein
LKEFQYAVYKKETRIVRSAAGNPCFLYYSYISISIVSPSVTLPPMYAAHTQDSRRSTSARTTPAGWT